ncbi:hypothetical protein V6N12_072620 [Hibiscus sabdariffa]|uniref:Uncharacterized protein n=1 Tax=Hibiscus sabdariffa TaxID=183260 RepID=A0ABR2BKB9_9ROSI
MGLGADSILHLLTMAEMLPRPAAQTGNSRWRDPPGSSFSSFTQLHQLRTQLSLAHPWVSQTRPPRGDETIMEETRKSESFDKTQNRREVAGKTDLAIKRRGQGLSRKSGSSKYKLEDNPLPLE